MNKLKKKVMSDFFTAVEAEWKRAEYIPSDINDNWLEIRRTTSVTDKCTVAKLVCDKTSGQLEASNERKAASQMKGLTREQNVLSTWR